MCAGGELEDLEDLWRQQQCHPTYHSLQVGIEERAESRNVQACPQSPASFCSPSQDEPGPCSELQDSREPNQGTLHLPKECGGPGLLETAAPACPEAFWAGVDLRCSEPGGEGLGIQTFLAWR